MTIGFTHWTSWEEETLLKFNGMTSGKSVKNIRASAKKGRHYRPGSSIAKASTTVSRMEITRLLKDFKEDIINNMATHFDTLQARKKHEEAKTILVEFCPHCRQKKRD